MDCVLAIDLGTGGPKVGLVGVDGSIRAHDFEPVSLHLSAGGGAEQDPLEWWRAISAASTRVMTGAAGVRVIAVSCSSQWSGTVPVGEDGPVGPALIWMDSRGSGQVERLIGGTVSIQGYAPWKLRTWIRLTGGAPGKSGKDPLAHILWLREARPEIYRVARVFLEPKDYLNLVMTGRAVATADSIALHWVTDNRDPAQVDYHPDLLSLTGLDRSTLPDIIQATDIVGPLLPDRAGELGVPAGIPVVGGTPDLHSAAIGSGGAVDFAPHLYVGTSSWLACHVPFKKTDIIRNVASLPAAVPGKYLVVNEQETAGAALDFLADTVMQTPPESDRSAIYQRLDHMAGRAGPGAGGVMFLPWLYGERTPVEDASLRAAFFNLSLSSTSDDVVRSVFEGVALNARWLLGAVERFVGRELPAITLVGGGGRSAVWGQIFADTLGRVVRRAEDPIATNLRGAGLLGALALGRIGTEGIRSAVPIAETHEPDPTVLSLYDDRFAEFVGFYKANRRAYRRLNG